MGVHHKPQSGTQRTPIRTPTRPLTTRPRREAPNLVLVGQAQAPDLVPVVRGVAVALRRADGRAPQAPERHPAHADPHADEASDHPSAPRGPKPGARWSGAGP